MSQEIESRLLAETDKLLKGEFAGRVNGREYWLRVYTTEHELGPFVTVAAAFQHPKNDALVLKVNESCALSEYGPDFIQTEWPYRTGDMLDGLDCLLRQALESAA